MSDYLAIRLHGVDGSVWDIEGPDAGAQGVWILPKPKQFWDTPAVTYWIKSGGALERYQGYSFKTRKPLFGLVAAADDPLEHRDIDSELRIALGMYDPTFEVEAIALPDGTSRRLRMRLWKDPEAFETLDFEGYDPALFGAGSMMVSAACEMPHWFGPPAVASWTNPTTVGAGQTNSDWILHPGNPGDVPVFARWYLNAPAKQWRIPDPSWGQKRPGAGEVVPEDAQRQYTVTELFAGEDVDLNSHPDEEFMRTVTGGLGPWMRSKGRTLIYPVKPHTPPTLMPISVTGAPAGVTATIEVDRWYSRPVGVSL